MVASHRQWGFLKAGEDWQRQDGVEKGGGSQRQTDLIYIRHCITSSSA